MVRARKPTLKQDAPPNSYILGNNVYETKRDSIPQSSINSLESLAPLNRYSWKAEMLTDFTL